MNSSINISTRKLNIIYALIIFAFVVVCAFLFRWQYFEHDKFTALANQRGSERKILGLRGSILASDGTYLAYSERVYNVYVSIKEVNELDQNNLQDKYKFYDVLAKTLNIKSEDLEKSLNDSESQYVKVADKVDIQVKNAIDNLEVDYQYADENGEIKTKQKKALGVHLEEAEKRIYPNDRLASHVIGFLGKDDLGNDIGRQGIEGFWNGDLLPKEGFVKEETDSKGNLILTSDYDVITSLDGRDVYTTINPQVQKVLEERLKAGIEKYKAKSGSVVVMNPKTGYVLGMANYPDFNPNEYYKEKDGNVFNNNVISAVYENGSVWKGFTASAAINEGLFEPDSIIFNSHPACIEVLDGRQICTARRNSVTSPTSLTKVLITSDNIGSYYIAKKLGPEKLYDYLIKFGIGNFENPGLANEQTDTLQSPDKWNELDLAVISFGQSEASTLFQTVSGYSAIANYGVRMHPTVVNKVKDAKSELDFEPKIEDSVIDPKTSEMMVDSLNQTFEAQGGQYYWRELANYRLAGKTGTAQIPKKDGPGYEEGKTNVTMIAFDASENRSFIMGLRLEEPEGGGFSSESALPVWVDIFSNLKDSLGVVPVR